MVDQKDTKETGGSMSRMGLGILLLAALLAAGVVAYRTLGDGGPDPAQPAANAEPKTIAQLKEAADADPLNAGAWQELGFAYFEMEQFSDAAKAYRQAIEGDPQNAVLWSSLGEARLMDSQSTDMPDAAITAFEKAIEIDPTDARARYFLAVRKDLAGNHQGAIDDWLALLQDTPPGAPWEANLRLTIEQVGKINNIPTKAKIAAADGSRPKVPRQPALTAGNAIPGPSREQIAAAGSIPPGEQRNMAEGMVESLDAKLQADPANPDGWVMLMRSRMTLGQPDKAKRALQDAIAANPDAAERLRREASALGVTD